MRDKGKVLIVTCFWLTIAVLAVLFFAGIISPQKAVSNNDGISLAAPTTTPAGRSTQLSVTVNNPVDELHATLSLDNGNRSATIGSLDLPGNLENLAIDRKRQLAFLANSFSGVQIVDISNPNRPSLLGVIATPGNAWDLLPRGDLLFVAAAQGGLQIIDTSTPVKPTRIAEFILPNKPFLKLAHHQDTIYASGGKHGLFIIDVADPAKPKLSAVIEKSGGAWGLIAAEKHLYLSADRYHLETYSLADPHRPKLTSRGRLPGRVWNMSLASQHLFVPTREEGLLVFNNSIPGEPFLAGRSKDRFDIESISIDGQNLLVTSRKKDLYTYDISNPAEPTAILKSSLAIRPRNVVLLNNLAYIASGTDGLQVFDIDRIPPQNHFTTLQLPGTLRQVAFDANHYYLATREHGLFIAEQQAGEQLPVIISSLRLPDRVLNMVRGDNHLYIACATGVQIVNISDPGKPELVNDLNIPGFFRDIAISGNNLFMTSSDGLIIANNTYADNPILLAQLPMTGAMSLVIRGDRAYVASTENGLHIIDISNPSAPLEISRTPLPWPLQEFAKFYQLAIDGEIVYLAAGESKLIIFDVGNERHPELAEIVHIDGETMAVAVMEKRVYAATRQGRLWLLEKENGKLAKHGVTDILGNCRNIMFSGEKLVLANGERGLTILTILSRPQQLTVRLPEAMSRARTPFPATIEIPPQAQPAVYNLALFQDGKVQEFFGAVKVTEKLQN